MCAIRYHLASHPVYGGGLGLANDLQTEHSMVGNNPFMIMVKEYGTPEQIKTLIPAMLKGEFRTTFGLTEIYHGSDATHMDTVAKKIWQEHIAPSGKQLGKGSIPDQVRAALGFTLI